MNTTNSFNELMQFQQDTQALCSIAGRLGWDQETMMPRGSADQRATEQAAIAKTIAKAGASVLVNAKTSGNAAKEVVNEISKKGGNAIYHLADVTDPKQVETMVEAAAKEFGRLDILVNNVGPSSTSPITEIGHDEWRNIVEKTSKPRRC